jgi:Uma2 family endonuclease
MPSASFFELPPDWVCEVVSPGTEADDRARKMPLYAREGVQHAWLINPLARTLEVYAPDSGRWTVLGAFNGKTKVRAAPFDSIEVDIALLWSD